MILEIIMDHAALFHVSQTYFSSNRVHSCLIHKHQPPRCPNLPHRCPKRQKRQLGDLEELPAKWNSDDCNVADNADYGIADTISQTMLASRLTAPPPYTTSFPNGKNARLANLKHCSPIGIPMIVMHHRQPDNTHASPLKSPPQTNQSMFPSMLM